MHPTAPQPLFGSTVGRGFNPCKIPPIKIPKWRTRRSRVQTFIPAARQTLAAEPTIQIDYIELVNWSTLDPVEIATPGTLFAMAAYVGPPASSTTPSSASIRKSTGRSPASPLR